MTYRSAALVLDRPSSRGADTQASQDPAMSRAVSQPAVVGIEKHPSRRPLGGVPHRILQDEGVMRVPYFVSVG